MQVKNVPGTGNCRDIWINCVLDSYSSWLVVPFLAYSAMKIYSLDIQRLSFIAFL
uniref:Uncharacterized protein n=1 Tax=Manihot esculenta TaxID=3983 RepID=A0A2C9VKG2_MANES